MFAVLVGPGFGRATGMTFFLAHAPAVTATIKVTIRTSIALRFIFIPFLAMFISDCGGGREAHLVAAFDRSDTEQGVQMV